MRGESWWVFALRLVMLLGFVVALGAMAPKLGFMLQHPGVSWPAGTLDYRIAATRGVAFFRDRRPGGVMAGYAKWPTLTDSGGVRGWSGVRALGASPEVPTRGSLSGAE